LINIVTIFLGVTVGATAVGAEFLKPQTLEIVALGLISFIFSTIGGLLIAKLMSWVTKGKINPLIGSAGVSAVPMAARVSQVEGQKANPGNYLLMHAMGPNVAGVIGSAVAAGILLSLFR
jgi:oxaloacetate decarboxylase beta subunit